VFGLLGLWLGGLPLLGRGLHSTPGVNVQFAPLAAIDPSGEAFERLVGLTRFYAGQEWDFDVQLILKAAEVPACRLGETGEQAPRLGWSTWLKPQERCRNADEAVLAGKLSLTKATRGRALAAREGEA